MDTSELIKKVRKIEIKTRGLSKHIFSGEYHSAFKGRGMAFSEVREYQFGDDIRNIDWNVTARFNHPYIKVFEEERELSVILLVDISASGLFGTVTQFKKDLITELCAVLSFSALQNNDKIGLILFSDKIEKFIPLKKGRYHVLRIIRELLEFKPESNRTDISVALRYLINVIKKRGIVFILSDFISKDFEEPLKIASKKHDTIAINIFDKRESELPNVGLIYAQDNETGELVWIDTSSIAVREKHKQWWLNHQKKLDDTFNFNSVDSIRIRTDQSYVTPLINFFRQREKRK
jgi:uncharacterized protein (DUF58 family)